MSIEIHEKCKKRLIGFLINKLPDLVVAGNTTIKRDNISGLVDIDRIIPRGELKDNLEKYLGSYPCLLYTSPSPRDS